MKKLLSALLVLLLLVPAFALADNEYVMAFKGFTLTLDPDMPMQFIDGFYDPGFVMPENEILFTLYPNYTAGDTASNLNATWSSLYEDFSTYSDADLQEFANGLITNMLPAYAEAGLNVNDYSLYEASHATLDGVDGIVIGFNLSMSVAGTALDLFQEQVYLSEPSRGTWCFTLSSTDQDSVYDVLEPVLLTLHWGSASQSVTSPNPVTIYTPSGVDFGDFTLDIDENMSMETAYGFPGTKTDGEVLLTLYPNADAGDTATSINVVWTADNVDFSSINSTVMANALATQFLIAAGQGYEEAGLTVADSKIIYSDFGTLDGLVSFEAEYLFTVDMTNLGVRMNLDMYQRQVMAGSDDMGLYVFTMSALSEEDIDAMLQPIVDSLIWN